MSGYEPSAGCYLEGVLSDEHALEVHQSKLHNEIFLFNIVSGGMTQSSKGGEWSPASMSCSFFESRGRTGETWLAAHMPASTRP